MFDLLNEHTRGNATHLVKRLANGRQTRVDQRRLGHIVEADNGNVVGNIQAAICRRSL